MLTTRGWLRVTWCRFECSLTPAQPPLKHCRHTLRPAGSSCYVSMPNYTERAFSVVGGSRRRRDRGRKGGTEREEKTYDRVETLSTVLAVDRLSHCRWAEIDGFEMRAGHLRRIGVLAVKTGCVWPNGKERIRGVIGGGVREIVWGAV